MSPFRLQLAAAILRNGGIVAHPTEAVWGLACASNQPAAIARLRELKQRPDHKGFILVAHDSAAFGPLLDTLTEPMKTKVLATWPGPATWLLPHNNLYDTMVSGHNPNIAARVSAHPLTSKLAELCGAPLLSSSANPASLRPAKTALEARRYFARDVDFYLNGALGGRSTPTPIRDAVTGETVRA